MLVELIKIHEEETTVVTSIDVAETFGKRHDHVLRDIEALKEDIPNFGEMFFESLTIDKYKRDRKIYHMNRDGFTLLVMGYTGEKAMQFKLGYIKQFNAMEKALKEILEERHRTEMERAKGIAVRQALTNSLKASKENDRMHGFAYSTYTDMIYRNLFGKSAKQIREENGLSKKDNLRDYFDADDLKKVQSKEMLVSGLIDCGWGYNEIKEFIKTESKKMIEVA